MFYRVLLDMDGVMFDTLGMWLDIYEKQTGDVLTKEEITDYKFRFLPEEKRRALFSVLDTEHFFGKLEPIPGAVEYTEKLLKLGCSISVVTAGMLDTAVPDKLQSLRTHFGFLGDPEKYTIFTHRKDIIKGDILFDDNPRNIKQFSDAGGITCIMDYAYNRGTMAHYRVMDNDWGEFYYIVRES